MCDQGFHIKPKHGLFPCLLIQVSYIGILGTTSIIFVTLIVMFSKFKGWKVTKNGFDIRDIENHMYFIYLTYFEIDLPFPTPKLNFILKNHL